VPTSEIDIGFILFPQLPSPNLLACSSNGKVAEHYGGALGSYNFTFWFNGSFPLFRFFSNENIPPKWHDFGDGYFQQMMTEIADQLIAPPTQIVIDFYFQTFWSTTFQRVVAEAM
jgi:hypothetical protein